MADDLCGPSNPVKGLGAHAERDRSLYQDRNFSAVNGHAGTVSPVFPVGDSIGGTASNRSILAPVPLDSGCYPSRRQ